MPETSRAPGRTFLWGLSCALLWPLLQLGLKLKISGRENLRRDAPQIIAANHTSHIDPPIVGYSSGLETAFLAKAEIFRISRAFAWLLRNYHAMPLSRGAGDIAALRQSSEILAQGRTLVLFPEGTRSKSGEFQPLRPGVAMLAITNQVPVVPAYITGVRRSFLPWLIDPDIIRWNRKHQPGRLKFRLASLFTSRVTIRFGRPLSPEGFERNRDDYRRMTEQIEQAMLDLAGTPDAGRRTLDATEPRSQQQISDSPPHPHPLPPKGGEGKKSAISQSAIRIPQ